MYIVCCLFLRLKLTIWRILKFLSICLLEARFPCYFLVNFNSLHFFLQVNSWEICCRCAEKLLAQAIFYKNSKIWKKNTSGISTYDFAFLRRRSRTLNCRKNFTNISSMESIYIISILIVDWFKIQAIKLHS
jgi:hypothetical protein